MEYPEAYREILNCLPQPACLLKDGAVLLQNAAAGNAFAALLQESVPQPPAVLTCGEWLYTLRPLGDLCLALASRAPQQGTDVSFLRLPLSELFGSVSALMPSVEELEDPAIHMQAAGVNRSLYRLYRSISNLEFSSSEPMSRFSQTDLTALLTELEAHIPQPCSGGVTVEAELPSRPVVVMTDPQLLQRAVLNLLSNAIRHARRGSTVRLQLTKQQGRAMITVRNEGTPADPDAVFGGAEKANWHGTAGLGLELVRKIMQTLGGTLLFRMPEDGTIATLALPAKSEEPCCGCVLRCSHFDGNGGFDTVLLELSDVLPAEVFLPEAID